MCVNMVDISHFDPGYAIIESEYVFVILKREMSLSPAVGDVHTQFHIG